MMKHNIPSSHITFIILLLGSLSTIHISCFVLLPKQHSNHYGASNNDVSMILSFPSVITFLRAAAKDSSSVKNKKNKSSPASNNKVGGGFGKSSSSSSPTRKSSSSSKTKNNNNDDDSDYAVFPPLNEGVKSTLIPTSSIQEEGIDLSNEMYDRLDQIYGFSNFNYACDTDTAISTMEVNNESSPSSVLDFNELLSASSSSTTASTTTFDDIIASVRDGDDNDQDIKTFNNNNNNKNKSNLKLSNLPPFSKFRVLHVDPMVLAIDDFFTDDECDRYIQLSTTTTTKTKDGKDDNEGKDAVMMRSKTVGKDSYSKAQRTSTTWFHHFESVPELMAKASRLLGLDDINRWEEPQTVRYQKTQKFTWHLDALSPSESLQESGGQRVATLLVYLSTIGENNGGATVFRDLKSGNNNNHNNDDDKYLRVIPKKGSALLFFPAAGGIPNVPFDIRTLHAGEAMGSNAPMDKWIAQLWLRENKNYKPTAPPLNTHAAASEAINQYCDI